jgi:hypothetical protein
MLLPRPEIKTTIGFKLRAEAEMPGGSGSWPPGSLN